MTKFGSGKRRPSPCRIGHIQLRLGVQEQECLWRDAVSGTQHRRRIQTASARQRGGKIAADRVRCLGQKAQARAGQLGQRLCQCVQLRRLRMLLREVAEENAFPATFAATFATAFVSAFAIRAGLSRQARGNCLRDVGGLDSRKRRGRRHACDGCRGNDDLGQCSWETRRCDQ